MLADQAARKIHVEKGKTFCAWAKEKLVVPGSRVCSSMNVPSDTLPALTHYLTGWQHMRCVEYLHDARLDLVACCLGWNGRWRKRDWLYPRAIGVCLSG